MTDLAGEPAYADTVLDLKQRLVDIINTEYVVPPPIGPEQAGPEVNPADPNGMKARGLNWCPTTDITMP